MTQKIYLANTSKPQIEIWAGGSDKPYRTVELNRHNRRYLHASLKQILMTYDPDGTENRKVFRFPIEKCDERNYKTEYEKRFAARFKEDNLYCAEEDRAYLQGTRDSRVDGEEHSYLIYEFAKCTEPVRRKTKVDPSCKDTKDFPCATRDTPLDPTCVS